MTPGIDPELAGRERAYYGSDAARLRAVERRDDPHGRLGFARG